MTNEELDEARCKEAERIYCLTFPKTHRMSTIAARLAREGWTPPEPADPDLLAAREWCASKMTADRTYYLSGKMDDCMSIPAYLAGCTRGREGAKGLVEALEALHNMASGALDSVSYGRVRSRLMDGIENARAALASAKRGG